MKLFVVPNYQKNATEEILTRLTSIGSYYGIESYVLPRQDILTENKLTEFYDNIISGKTPEHRRALESADIIVSVGGDGTVIHCAQLSAAMKKPILGINTGHLGFLTKVEDEQIAACLEKLALDHYSIEYRNGITADFHDKNVTSIDFALNDIVITKTPLNNILKLNISCNDVAIDSYSADGVIFSTSTGSTAYNLSAGGPVIDPLLDVITMVPICPHSITTKPLVFSESRKISVVVPTDQAMITADGSRKIIVEVGAKITISTSTKKVGFVTFGNDEFFEVLARKMRQRS